MSLNISAQRVKELRTETGAGMMDCKKALQESGDNFEQAKKLLCKKGLASANKKSSRITAEGIIESYIHTGSRIGIMLEINCETDFVARRKEFQELSRNLAMQIAACPMVEYIDKTDIPLSIIEKERIAESDKNDLIDKDPSVRLKIVEGRMAKRLEELSLLNQSFIRNPDITIDNLIKQNIAILGENIRIRRFVRFVLGEGLDKKIDTFAQEVKDIIAK